MTHQRHPPAQQQQRQASCRWCSHHPTLRPGDGMVKWWGREQGRVAPSQQRGVGCQGQDGPVPQCPTAPATRPPTHPPAIAQHEAGGGPRPAIQAGMPPGTREPCSALHAARQHRRGPQWPAFHREAAALRPPVALTRVGAMTMAPGCMGRRPAVGRSATPPVAAAGQTTEPHVSAPTAKGRAMRGMGRPAIPHTCLGCRAPQVQAALASRPWWQVRER
jgi:hypothetical protein